MTRIVLVLTLVAVLAWTAPASAAPITFAFTATIDSSDPVLATVLPSGAVLTGTYTFDSGQSDGSIDPAVGLYAILQFEGHTDAWSFAAGPPVGGTLTILNDLTVSMGQLDAYELTTGLMPSGLISDPIDPYILQQATLSLFLVSAAPHALSSDGLPVFPPDLSDFDGRNIFLRFAHVVDGGAYTVRARLDTLTLTREAPEPGTGVLLLTAGLAVAIRRRINRAGQPRGVHPSVRHW